jgi:leader peptidase (prepilin peptidase) / N-methyltransferase
MSSLSDHGPGAPHAAQALPGSTLPARYPAHRIAAAALALGLTGALVVRFGLGAHSVLAAFVACVLVAVSVVDLEERRIPNRIVLPATGVVLVAQVLLEPARSAEWLLASFGAALFLFLPRLAYPAGMGLGDVKLALLLGAALGQAVIPAMSLAVFAAFVVAVAVMVRGGVGARKTSIPFGPFLAAGALVVLLT